jgi:hypothetical protein
MSTTNQAYVSKSVPFGAIDVQVYRLADPDDNNSGALLGTYKAESIVVGSSDILNKRPDVDGGKNGWWLITGDREGSCVLQRAVAATPSLETGDYFSASIRVDAAGTPVAERFVIYNPSETTDTSYRKVSASCIVDDQV